MSRPDLYLCHTPYQVLIAMVRALRSGGCQALVLSRTVPDTDEFAKRLTISSAFSEVHIVDEAACPGVAAEGPLRHWRNRRNFEHCCGWHLHKGLYRNIYISNDWSVLGRYLQDCHARYILCEDTLGGTMDADQHLLDAQRCAPGFAQQQSSGKDWLYWGDCLLVKQIESEDAARCTVFAKSRLATFSKSALLHGLTSSEKAQVREVFLTQNLPSMAEDATLLLPRSFVLDGLMAQPEQDAIFKAVAARYIGDGPLFIKTHPRDETDYHALFPDAIILDRTMPSEVLNFCLPFRFARAVTVQSWVLRSFTAAEETVFLTLDEAKALVKA